MYTLELNVMPQLIGLQSTENAAELQKNKGHGFGLMNCKGIIDKYRKTNDIFRICTFNIESEPGRGSRFYFRLPKGIRKILMLILISTLSLLSSCGENHLERQETMTPEDSVQCYDKWLTAANN